jgi:hypothetical protein
MRRRTFDTTGGIVVTAVLVNRGRTTSVGGHNFANTNVHGQLAQQQITFSAKGSAALAGRAV